MPAISTGIAVVDQVLRAFANGDPDSLAALAKPTVVPCEVEPISLPSGSLCLPGEPVGTAHEYFNWTTSCNSSRIGFQDARGVLVSALRRVRRLWGVVRTEIGFDIIFLNNDPSGARAPGSGAPVTLIVLSASGVTGVSNTCLERPEDVYSPSTDFLIAPLTRSAP